MNQTCEAKINIKLLLQFSISLLIFVFLCVKINARGTERKKALLIGTEVEYSFRRMEGTVFGWEVWKL